MTPVDALDEVTRRAALIVGTEHVRHDIGPLAAYDHDATPGWHGTPDLVVFPADTRQVAELMRLASHAHLPVVPRGAGTNLCAATVPTRGGMVLALTRLNQIIEVNPDELLLRTQPGVSTSQVAAAAAEHGLLYPPDPGAKTVSTIGGNAATCAGGLRGLKYGVTRNYVLGLEAVLADGTIIRTGGRLWKDVAGYDLTRLLVGSEGTLAVLTELTLALIPVPDAALTGMAYFPDLASAGAAVTAIIRAGIVPSTLEFLDQTCIRAVEDYACLGLDTRAGALLLFGDDGDRHVVALHLQRMAEICSHNEATGVEVADDAAMSEELLNARRCSLPALARAGGLTILEDASVPRPAIPEMVRRIRIAAERHDTVIGTFGHAGDGNLHPTAVVDASSPNAAARAHAAFQEIFAHALDLGGTITGEHGVGSAKLAHLRTQLGADQTALQRRLKQAFDPNDILNPGKLGSA